MTYIKIKYINNSLPDLAPYTLGDMIDLYVSGNYTYKKGDTVLVKLGVAMELPEGYEAHIYPRSSTFKHHGLILTNSVGIIDNSYNGDNDEWMAMFYATQDGHLAEGSRVVQFRIYQNMPETKLITVNSLNNTDRGGYGSTGV